MAGLTIQEIDDIDKYYSEWDLKNLKRQIRENKESYKKALEFKEFCNSICGLPDVMRAHYYEETAYDFQKMMYSYKGETVLITNRKESGIFVSCFIRNHKVPIKETLKSYIENVHLKITAKLEEDKRV